MAFYLRCRGCLGLGLHADGFPCQWCRGWGGFWVLTGTRGGGLSMRVVPGDAGHKPEEPP